MNKEESLDLLQKAFHAQKTGGSPPWGSMWDPMFAAAVKTAIDTLVIEVSKQKMKEYKKTEIKEIKENDN